jgi:RNA polymerase sigma-70 factor (ECF subfamily)
MSVSIEFTPAVEARAPCPVQSMDGVDFSTLFREFSPFVWRVLERFGVPSAEVPDVCQETFIIIHRKLDGFRSESSLRTWIFGICVRTASDYRRRAHVRHEKTQDPMPEQTVGENQHATAEARQALARLDAALRGLDDGKRAIFVAYELEELSMEEAALAAGCPVKTAYARLYAARKHIEAAFRRGGRP